jgi:ketosteroid isomerase-like protein
VTVETLRRLLDAFNAHDLDAVMSFFTDDAVLELPCGPQAAARRAGNDTTVTGEPASPS